MVVPSIASFLNERKRLQQRLKHTNINIVYVICSFGLFCGFMNQFVNSSIWWHKSSFDLATTRQRQQEQLKEQQRQAVERRNRLLESLTLDPEDLTFFKMNQEHKKPIPKVTNDKKKKINKKGNDKPGDILWVWPSRTGGQSIRFALDAGCDSFALKAKRRKQCKKEMPPTELTKRVKGLLHNRRMTMKPEKATGGFLVSMRHPLERSISWYMDTNPNFCDKKVDANSQNCAARRETWFNPNGTTAEFFNGCFPATEHLNQAFSTSLSWSPLLQKESRLISKNCQYMAHLVWKGKTDDFEKRDDPGVIGAYFGAMAQNMRYYAEEAQFKPPVYLARTDTLWDDMKVIDQRLGGEGDFGKIDGLHLDHHNAVRNSKMTAMELTQATRQAMCCLLWDDLGVYRKLLAMAENLSFEEGVRTWKDALYDCGQARAGGDDTVLSWKTLQETCRDKKLSS